VAAAVVAAVSASSRLSAEPPSPFLPQPPLAPPHELVFYGHVTSVTRSGGRWLARVDPALFLVGLTANRAAVADKAIAPGDSVPNDNYVRDESRRLLTYRVSPSARITVVTNAGAIVATRVGPAELGQVVQGRNPRHRTLFEPKNGYWIRVAGDTIRSLDQQYTP
jgi:hypothetical protein